MGPYLLPSADVQREPHHWTFFRLHVRLQGRQSHKGHDVSGGQRKSSSKVYSRHSQGVQSRGRKSCYLHPGNFWDFMVDVGKVKLVNLILIYH